MTWSITASGNRAAIAEIIDKNLNEEAQPKAQIKELILHQLPENEDEEITIVAGGSTYLGPSGKSGSIGVNASFKVAEKPPVTENVEQAQTAAHAETEADAA